MAGPETTAVRLAVRLVRNGVLILAVSLAATVAVVVASFTAASLGVGGLDGLADNPALRALYGRPFDLSTAGGFTAWRIGQFLAVVAGLWAVMATTRVLRGEEEAGRWDLALSSPLDRGRMVGGHLAALGGGCVLAAIAAAVPLLADGEPTGGSLMFGAGLGLLALVFVGVGTITSQLFAQRRRAAGIGGLVLGALFAIRMAADASSSFGWLRWATPFGWVEEIRPFAGDRVLPLLLVAAAAVVLFAAGWSLAGRRDLGEGIVREEDTAVARPRLLRSPVGFAWRQRLVPLMGWGFGLLAFGFVIGGITSAFVDYISTNADVLEFLARHGFADLATAGGFVGTVYQVAAVVFSLFVVTSMHVAWEDERDGRLAATYAEPVTRSRWLGAQVATAVVAVIVIVVVCAVGVWAGTIAGGAALSIGDAFVGAANTLFVVALFLGIAVLLHGARPELGMAIAGGAVAASYLLTFLGPIADLPDWLLALSPIRHLALAPSEPVAWAAGLAMAGVGVVAGAIGFAGYARRDLR